MAKNPMRTTHSGTSKRDSFVIAWGVSHIDSWYNLTAEKENRWY